MNRSAFCALMLVSFVPACRKAAPPVPPPPEVGVAVVIEWSANVNFQWELDLWGWIRRQNEAAQGLGGGWEPRPAAGSER